MPSPRTRRAVQEEEEEDSDDQPLSNPSFVEATPPFPSGRVSAAGGRLERSASQRELAQRVEANFMWEGVWVVSYGGVQTNPKAVAPKQDRLRLRCEDGE